MLTGSAVPVRRRGPLPLTTVAGDVIDRRSTADATGAHPPSLRQIALGQVRSKVTGAVGSDVSVESAEEGEEEVRLGSAHGRATSAFPVLLRTARGVPSLTLRPTLTTRLSTPWSGAASVRDEQSSA